MQKVPAMVYVKWVDSSSHGETNWTSIETFKPEEITETICETLGYVVGESLHSIFVAGHIGLEEYGAVWQIPRSSIKEMREVGYTD